LRERLRGPRALLPRTEIPRKRACAVAVMIRLIG
jgi:hypothetical protein